MSQAGAANDGGVDPSLIVETLTGNSGGAVGPTANNINTLGTGSITVVGSPGTSTLTTQLTGLTNHNVLVGAGTATITNVAPSATSGVPLISQGAASDPAFGTAVVAGGGTGVTSTTAYAVLCGGTTSTNPLQSIASVGTAGQVLTSNGAGALPTFQAAAGGNTIAINALYTSGATNVTGDGTVYAVVWNTVNINRGSYYNAANGQFTSTTDGLYSIAGAIGITGLAAGHVSLQCYLTDVATGSITWDLLKINPYNMSFGATGQLVIPFCNNIRLQASTAWQIYLVVSGGAKTISLYVSNAECYFGMFGPL